MSFTHAIIDAQAVVERLTTDEGHYEIPEGMTLVELASPQPHWPEPPTASHILKLVSGQFQWEDPRSEAERADVARAQRDSLLKATDWWVVKSIESGQPMTQAQLTYRQSLRDISEQEGFPDDITWPQMP